MLPERKEHARQIIEEARQIRCMFGSAGLSGAGRQGALLSMLKSYDQLLELADSLLSEQEQYESRLHRSSLIDHRAPRSAIHQ